MTRCASLTIAIVGVLSMAQCGGKNAGTPVPPTTTVAVAGVSLSPTSTAAGSTVQGTVALTGGAPAGGATVTLTSSNTAVATVPASVAIAAGSSSATFTVTAVSPGTASITASFNGTGQAALTVTQQQSTTVTLLSIGLNAPTIVGGQSVDGVVTLSGPAPSGGAAVTLQSSDATVATVPGSVTVAAGATTATFTVTSRATGGAFQLVISAVYQGVTRSANLTVGGTPPPLALSSVSVNAPTIASGSGTTGTVTMNQVAPSGGAVVTLSSSPAGFVTTPASVTVLSGQSSATFPVVAASTTTARTATITATFNGASQTTNVNITASAPPAPVATFSVGGPSGSNTCKLNSPGGTAADCTFDGTSSTAAATWEYSYVVGSQSRTGTSTTGILSPTFLGCGAFQSDFPTGSTTSIQMVVRLRVRDAAGNLSPEFVNQNVKISAGACGYSF